MQHVAHNPSNHDIDTQDIEDVQPEAEDMEDVRSEAEVLIESDYTVEPQDEDQESFTHAEEEEVPSEIAVSGPSANNQTIGMSNDHETHEPDLKVLLHTLSDKLMPEEQTRNIINVCREDIMDGATRAFSRRTFKPEARMSVVFMDSYDQAEGSVDEGGPSREFYRLLLLGIKNSPLFFGQEHKSLALDTHALGKSLYKTYGKMIAVALVHGGVSPRFLSERLYNSLCGIPVPPPTLEDVSDPDLKEKLGKIRDATDITSARMEIEEASDTLSLLGSLRFVSSLEGRDELVQCATTFYVDGRTKEALEQFSEGLQTLGLLELVRSHPVAFRDVFCCSVTPLRAFDLVSLFEPELSTPGSNLWRTERRVEGFWRDFLLEVEDGEHPIRLENIMVFASGADTIPVLGFPTHPSLGFIHEHGRRYPEANTCLIKLKLPIHRNYEEDRKSVV